MYIALWLAFGIFLCYLYDTITIKTAMNTMINIYKTVSRRYINKVEKRMSAHPNTTIIFDNRQNTAVKPPPD